jgi:tRNA 2-selenouridine synthase
MQINFEELQNNPDAYRVIDVRTYTEFLEGSVVGSLNVPLFDGEEREKIGLIYKKTPKAAKFVAMDLIGPKLSKYIRRIHALCYGKTPVIVCWRGGMRSRATVELMHMAGIGALQLDGGYRRYRQNIYQELSTYQLQNKLVLIKGKSGTGKTEILEALGQMGYPVLDLEGLANHRGSAFGGFDKQRAATQKNFDAHLLTKLNRMKKSKWLLVEGESKRIGNIYLPEFLFQRMRTAPVIEVTCPVESRVERIARDYSPKSHEARMMMYRALSRLGSKVSRTDLSELKQCLDNEDYTQFVNLVLAKHYDNIYDHQLPGKEVLATINSGDIKMAAVEIAAIMDRITD